MTLIADQTVAASVSQFTTSTTALANYSRCLIRLTLINVTMSYSSNYSLGVRGTSGSFFHLTANSTSQGPWNTSCEVMLYAQIGGYVKSFIALSSGYNTYSNQYTATFTPGGVLFIGLADGSGYTNATGSLNFKFYAA